MSRTLAPVPFRMPIIQQPESLASDRGTPSFVDVKVWLKWFVNLLGAVNASAQQVGTVTKTLQSAAITTTTVPIQTVTAGLYRVNYAARVTRAATTSSSLTVTIGWTDGTIAQSQAGAALTGNTTATQQNASFLVHVDNASAITYAAAYASVGGTTMQYALYVTAEALP